MRSRPKFIQPDTTLPMTIRRLLILCLSHAFTDVRSQSPEKPPARFTPPVAHHIRRYERTLSGNPFTLSTAPEPAAATSPLADWSLASVYGPTTGPTVAVVNMKTHERVRLQAGGTGSNGMRLITTRLGGNQKDTRVVVDIAGERHELRFNLEWLRQTAAAGGGQRLPGVGGGLRTAKAAAVVPSRPVAVVSARDAAHRGDPASIAGQLAGALPQRASPLFAAVTTGPGFQMDASAPGQPESEVAGSSASASDSQVWTQLESAVPVPLRRHPLRATAFEPHPDPQ
jgi:hypothetical protein